MGFRDSLIECGADMNGVFKLPGAGIYTTFNEILDHGENDESYLIKGRSVYMICYTPRRGFYAHKMATKPAGGVGLTNPGFYQWADKNLAHKMIQCCHNI